MNKLPRKSLREPAFRRYEPHIARGCKESFTVDPQQQKPPCKPTSFITGFTEAKLGFKKFGYGSMLIPIGYDLDRVRPFETDNGLVLIENAFEDRQKQLGNINAVQASVVIENGSVVRVNSKQKPTAQTVVRDDVALQTACEALTSGAANGFVTLVLVAPGVDTSHVKTQWPNVEIEQLAEGWQRLC